MMVLNEAIIHLKDVTSLNFSVDGNIVFRQVGEFLHVYNNRKKLISVATSEISYIEYFYSEAKSE